MIVLKYKTCNTCKEEKLIKEYHKGKTKDGYKNKCKFCCSIEKKEYDFNNKIKNSEYRKMLKETGKRKNYLSEYNIKNKSKNLEKKKEYRNSDIGKINTKNWLINNPEYMSNYNKNYWFENKENILAKQKEWKNKNKHIISWRNILHRTLRFLNTKKIKSTKEMLGYSALELKQHIQSLFTDGMSWDNYGEWHIDHIKPIISFPKDTPPSIVNALSNLQPLWATTREINGVIYEGNLNKHIKYVLK